VVCFYQKTLRFPVDGFHPEKQRFCLRIGLSERV